MTTYDEIWTTFLVNTKVDDLDLPSTPEKIHDFIHNGILLFNNKLRVTITWDDASEAVSEVLSNDNLIILANFIRLVFLKNQLTYFQNTWQPFQKDIGLKNFGSQLKSLENSVEYQEEYINKLIINTREDFL